MQQQIKFGGKTILFSLAYKDRKSLSIKVHPDSRVEVTAPMIADQQQVLKKVRTKAPWILKQIEHFKRFKPGTPPRRFINGETHLYLGRQYRLKIVRAEEESIKAYRGQLFVYSKSSGASSVSKKLVQWYRERAEVIYEELLNEVFSKFKRYKITKPQITIRSMSKRWGSCTSKGRIILNSQLIKAPKGCIEYVIIHELCHLVHFNHNRKFQLLLRKMMPDWAKWKERLETILL